MERTFEQSEAYLNMLLSPQEIAGILRGRRISEHKFWGYANYGHPTQLPRNVVYDLCEYIPPSR